MPKMIWQSNYSYFKGIFESSILGKNKKVPFPVIASPNIILAERKAG